MPEAGTRQMILDHNMTMVGQPVTGRHLGPAESPSNKYNGIRGRSPSQQGRTVSLGRPLSQGDIPTQDPPFQTASRLKVTCLSENKWLPDSMGHEAAGQGGQLS